MIKSFLKRYFVLCFVLFSFLGFGFADSYVFFYGNGCPHCAKVEKFFEDNDIYNKFDIQSKEVYFDANNRADMMKALEKVGLDPNNIGVPFMFIESDDETCSYSYGSKDIIEYFENKLADSSSLNQCGDTSNPENASGVAGTQDNGKFKFFAIMLPAAFADSINPCAFAVMLLLLTAILTKKRKISTTMLAGFMFSLAVFLSYFAMGIGLYKAFASATNTFYLKIIIGALGILVGLANLKDVFWYGKGFVMEVPFAWRPKMQEIISKVISPAGAFIVGVIVSLFLLPCTSGPYFTILGYLAAENKDLNLWGYIYLFFYNFIFILPMLAITLLVSLGISDIDKLSALKNKHNKWIHLIVGILMLGLGIYILTTI